MQPNAQHAGRGCNNAGAQAATPISACERHGACFHDLPDEIVELLLEQLIRDLEEGMQWGSAFEKKVRTVVQMQLVSRQWGAILGNLWKNFANRSWRLQEIKQEYYNAGKPLSIRYSRAQYVMRHKKGRSTKRAIRLWLEVRPVQRFKHALGVVYTWDLWKTTEWQHGALWKDNSPDGETEWWCIDVELETPCTSSPPCGNYCPPASRTSDRFVFAVYVRRENEPMENAAWDNNRGWNHQVFLSRLPRHQILAS